MRRVTLPQREEVTFHRADKSALSAPTFDTMKKNNFLNKLCRVTYEDAHYSYDDIDINKFVIPPPVVSIGKVRRITDQLIDLSPVKNESKSIKGIIIPIRAVKEIIALSDNE